MLKDFKEFAMRGNVMDMAIGIIIGAAFGKIVNSLVNDILMPPLGFILGKVDFSNLSITLLPKTATFPGVMIGYGVFINAIVNFIIVAFAMFIVVKQMNKLFKSKAEPTTKECSYCFSTIPIKASRCPNCTSQLQNTDS